MVSCWAIQTRWLDGLRLPVIYMLDIMPLPHSNHAHRDLAGLMELTALMMQMQTAGNGGERTSELR